MSSSWRALAAAHRLWLAELQAGDGIEARLADGTWTPGVAASDVEGTHRGGRKIHDFPVVWVRLAGRRDALPWPIEDLRPPTPPVRLIQQEETNG